MSWTDDFTTNHFATGSADYTQPFGAPDSVAPHALAVSNVLWVDERPAHVQTFPFDIEIDVAAGGALPSTLGVVGAITADLGNGFYGGFYVGKATIIVADNTVPALQIVHQEDVVYPAGAYTIKFQFALSGVITLTIGAQVYTVTADPALVTALAARTLGALGYFATSTPLTVTEWRYGGGAGGAPPVVPGTIVAAPHVAGLVRRPPLWR